MSTLKHWSGKIAICCSLILVLTWPALYNGQPFFYQDTTAYIRGADAGVFRLTHRATVWSDRNPVNPKNVKTVQAPSPTRTGAPISDRVVLAGRSVYYGTALYLAHVLGRLWPAVFLQGALALASIWLTMRAFGVFTLARLTGIVLALALVTPLAFFNSFLMPDVFAGFSILAAANLLTWGDQMRRWVFVFWAALLTAALLFHSSHVLIITGVLALMTLVFVTHGGMWMQRAGWSAVFIAIVIAVVGEVAFNLGVKRFLGVAPVRPAYVTARMIVDGPGYRYLVANCGSEHFAVCQFLQRLPMSDSDGFLWSVTDAADPDTRRKLGEEQFRFAWAVTRFDPVGVATATARDTFVQLSRIGVEEFRYRSGKDVFYSAHVPEPYLSKMRSSKAWNQQVPTTAFAIATAASTILAIGAITMLALGRNRTFLRDRSAVLFAEIVIGGIAINAFVCGSVSNPYDRYGARVIWLLPFTAIVLRQRSLLAYADHSPLSAERVGQRQGD